MCSVSDPERGQSSANDPVTISPAGSYVPITTPVVETLLSTSFNPEGMVPSENRRFPDPMTRGRTCSSGPSSFLSADALGRVSLDQDRGRLAPRMLKQRFAYGVARSL